MSQPGHSEGKDEEERECRGSITMSVTELFSCSLRSSHIRDICLNSKNLKQLKYYSLILLKFVLGKLLMH